MLYDLSMSESNKYENVKNNYTSTVYVIQEIAGTKSGNPKIILWVHQTMDNLNFVTRVFTNDIFSWPSYI